MIDEERQDQASLYVLRMLPPAEALAFARELEHDPELQQLVSQLEDSASTVALAAPLRRPPFSLRSRVLATIRGEATAASSNRGLLDWIPWTLAAGLALTAGTFWYEARTVREGLTAAQREIAQLRDKPEYSPPRIATLEAMPPSAAVAEYSPPLGVVVFDTHKQEGVVKLKHVPEAGEGKDYQLWIIDPSSGKPVSAGILRPSQDGSVTFKPSRPLPSADTFAVSVEPSGGSEQPTGPVILQGKFVIGQ